MATKKKKSKMGRPATGVNTVTISFSVHKDFAEIVKVVVKETVQKLKANANGLPLPADYLAPSHIAILKEDGSTEKLEFPKKPATPAVNSFLEGRRKNKLGLK